MIKDLELMKDITPLFTKRLLIWGIGERGRVIVEEIKAMGAGKAGILLCDSDRKLWGESVAGSRVLSPEELQMVTAEADLNEVIALVTVCAAKVQDEIIQNIEELFGESLVVYTEYAIRYGIYLNIKNPYVDSEYRRQKLIEHEYNRQNDSQMMLKKEERIRYFALLPLYNDEIILVYQPAKVGSSSVYKSIKNYDRYVLHCHTLTDVGDAEDDLYRLLNLKSGKIISLVREPVARRISEMWQGISLVNRYSAEVNFQEIENFYFDDECQGAVYEFEWFNKEIKRLFQIDIYEHPFDTEKGYTIIKQGNIELLLMKMEKLNVLGEVLGEFLNIDHFELQYDNVGSEKPYRFALQAYKDSFSISRTGLDNIYKKNELVKHFYSESERDELYRKWMKYVKD